MGKQAGSPRNERLLPLKWPIGFCAETSEGSNQCRGGNTAVAGHIFFAQLLFQRVDIELAFSDDSFGDGARQDRSQGFNDPLVIEAITSAAYRVFGTAVGALESRLNQ